MASFNERDIPKYIKDRKLGMTREIQVQNQWNEAMQGPKKKRYNVKRKPFDDIEEEVTVDTFSSVELDHTFSTEAPTIKHKKEIEPEAKRQPNSGAMWHAKGDITLEHALVEVKERGTVNARGEKTISIPKLWLDKQADEAFQENKPFWYLAFAYKGSEEVYIIKPYEDEIEMVAYLRQLQNENEILRQELEEAKASDNS